MHPVRNFSIHAASPKARVNSAYFGPVKLNMQACAANNFTPEDLHEVSWRKHKNMYKCKYRNIC